MIESMEPVQLVMICENNVPLSILTSCFDFWSKLNIITKNDFLRYFNNWTGKNIKKTNTIRTEDLWAFSEKQLTDYRNYVELNGVETLHQQGVRSGVEPEDNINERNIVNQNPDKCWLTITIVFRTYTNLKDQLGDKWTDSVILLRTKVAQMICKSADQKFMDYHLRSVKLFLKNYLKREEKKGIFITVND